MRYGPCRLSFDCAGQAPNLDSGLTGSWPPRDGRVSERLVTRTVTRDRHAGRFHRPIHSAHHRHRMRSRRFVAKFGPTPRPRPLRYPRPTIDVSGGPHPDPQSRSIIRARVPNWGVATTSRDNVRSPGAIAATRPPPRRRRRVRTPWSHESTPSPPRSTPSMTTSGRCSTTCTNAPVRTTRGEWYGSLRVSSGTM